MAEFIMVGCDLHDKAMLLKIAADRGASVMRSWGTDRAARQSMVADLKRRAAVEGAARIVFAYEACGFGFRLHDELKAAGIECHVLAPSKMKRSVKHRKGKTDQRDAEAILDYLRGHLLGGSQLPSVWVPDARTRQDRELVRQRLATAEDVSAVKTKIRWLLKRNGIESAPADSWTCEYWGWLHDLAEDGLSGCAGQGLASLLRHLDWLSAEKQRLDEQVAALSGTDRYREPVARMRRHPGVGILTAMVYLTELGDLSRFANRRQVAAYLGLTPTSYETGPDDDHKGHITRQGPGRVRKVLCQAVWSRLRLVEAERAAYARLVVRNPKRRKIAVVARMRTLAVVLWHEGLSGQEAARSAQVAGVA